MIRESLSSFDGEVAAVTSGLCMIKVKKRRAIK